MKTDGYIELINSYLSTAITTENELCSGLSDAMQYSLNAGGKRLRPIFVLEFCRISGGDFRKALPVAAAVEMLHTYSLIHDDLPAMDNDSLRRGKPTSHIVFGECNAILAGDALQAEAFYQIAGADLSDEVRITCIHTLSKAAGLNGMCGGQYLDTNSFPDEGDAFIDTVNSLKTGALITAACRMGVLCGEGSPEQIEAAERFGQAFGKAFQIRDDMLDVTGDEKTLGKNIGSDVKENKNNYMSLYGETRCAEMVSALLQQAKEALLSAFDEPAFLLELTDSMADRNS